ncbi:MAG: hypothetical protein HC922_02325 [Leptolyngbyaceae cyanobacterium SM2_3_12]|nr:hypothetical protein [Leptolyngbyaceae cyanobacterium SM2_3_12]
MANPPPQEPNSSNGSKSESHDHNGQGNLNAKLPKAPPPRSSSPEQVSPQTRRDVRRAFLTLLISGLVIGAITAAGGGVVHASPEFNWRTRTPGAIALAPLSPFPELLFSGPKAAMV